MSLWDLIFGDTNPTRSWQRDPKVPLVLDLDRHTLSNVGIGDPFDRFAFLGPGEPDFGFAFRELGLALSESDGRVSEITVYFGNAAQREDGVFPGEVHFRGKPVEVSCKTTESQLFELLGEPVHLDEDDEETILFYLFGGEHEWEIELDLQGRLKAWWIGRPLPIDPDQRRFYGLLKTLDPKADPHQLRRPAQDEPK